MYNFNKEKHLHAFDGKALTGTSTVMGVIAKPLTWWASGLACQTLGWRNPKKVDKETRHQEAETALGMIKALDADSYLSLLDKAYRAHSEVLQTTAEAGTDLHAELERYVKNTMEGKEESYDDKIKPFIEWSEKNVKRFLWSEMHTYSTQYWLGGITDAGAELNNGEYAIIDFKSSKEAYPSQFWQIAGYDIQLQENGGYTSEGKKMFTLDKPVTQHIIVPFGAKDVYPVVSREVESGKRAFLAALTIYRELAKLENQ